MKSVFIALVTSKRHKKFIKGYLKMVQGFTYPELSLHIVETTHNSRSYYTELKKVCSKYEFVESVDRYNWDPKKEFVFKMMAGAKNILRDRFLDGNYDLYFSLDTDTILPDYSVSLLVEDNKDNVGFPSPIWGHEPCVLKQGGFHLKTIVDKDFNGTIIFCDDGSALTKKGWTLDVYSWYELISKMRTSGSYMFKVYAVGNGCLLSKRKVIKKVKWEVPNNFVIGEDLIWYENVNRNGYEFWVDMRVIPIHMIAGWADVPTWYLSQTQRLYILTGCELDEEELTVENVKKKISEVIAK